MSIPPADPNPAPTQGGDRITGTDWNNAREWLGGLSFPSSSVIAHQHRGTANDGRTLPFNALPPGSMLNLSADEADAKGTTTTLLAKSYALASNAYTRVIAESEINISSNTVAFDVLFDLIMASTVVDEWDSAMGSTSNNALMGTLKGSQQQFSAATIAVNVTVKTGSQQWDVRSLRVYGIV